MTHITKKKMYILEIKASNKMKVKQKIQTHTHKISKLKPIPPNTQLTN